MFLLCHMPTLEMDGRRDFSMGKVQATGQAVWGKRARFGLSRHRRRSHDDVRRVYQ